MYFATVTTIQIFTLVVAALAAVASVVGIVVNTLMTRRYDHRVWLREMRVRIYSDVIERSEKFSELVLEYDLNPEFESGGDAREAYVAEHISQLSEAWDQLSLSTADVFTFGSELVSDAAMSVNTLSNDCFGEISRSLDCNFKSGSFVKFREALNGVRSAIRESMGVTDD